jgi:hypothetical protein
MSVSREGCVLSGRGLFVGLAIRPVSLVRQLIINVCGITKKENKLQDPTRQAMHCDVTLWRVRVTIFAMKKQK